MLTFVVGLALPVTLIAAGIPLILKRIPPNDLYGYRSRAVLASPQVWYRVNQFLGWALAAAGVAAAIVGGMAIARGTDPVDDFSVAGQIGLCLAALLVTWCYSQLLPGDKSSAGSAARAPTFAALGTVLTWLAAISGIVLAIPLVIGAVPPNGLYGYRTTASINSAALWYRANHVLGWAMLVAGVASAALAAAASSPDRRSMRGRALLLEVLLFLVAAAVTWGYVQFL